MMAPMVDPLYRALVLATAGLAGCGGSHAPDSGTPETDANEAQDIAEEDVSVGDAGQDVGEEDAGGQEDAPCPADAERQTPPCYFIL